VACSVRGLCLTMMKHVIKTQFVINSLKKHFLKYTSDDYSVVNRNTSYARQEVQWINDLCVYDGKAKLYLTQTVGKHEHMMDISITVFWDVASSRFTEWGKSAEQTTYQTRLRHIPLHRQIIQNYSDSLHMSRYFYWNICCIMVVCYLYYKPKNLLYKKLFYR
jgi:hypothetical protein